MRKLKKYKPTEFMAEDSHYDKAEADFAVNFIENLCHTKGTWARKKFELMDWQEQIIRDVFGTIKPKDILLRMYGIGMMSSENLALLVLKWNRVDL